MRAAGFLTLVFAERVLGELLETVVPSPSSLEPSEPDAGAERFCAVSPKNSLRPFRGEAGG